MRYYIIWMGEASSFTPDELINIGIEKDTLIKEVGTDKYLYATDFDEINKLLQDIEKRNKLLCNEQIKNLSISSAANRVIEPNQTTSTKYNAVNSQTKTINIMPIISNIWNALHGWFKDTSERNRLIRSFNNSARDSFVSGSVPTLLKATSSKGDGSYKHQCSHMWNTGFRIQAFTRKQLSKQELMQIGAVVLNDGLLVRQLVVLGWDTLEVHGDSGKYGCKWQLKDFIMLPN